MKLRAAGFDAYDLSPEDEFLFRVAQSKEKKHG
jgi:hypothetical protein